jgi:hypothetical protein
LLCPVAAVERILVARHKYEQQAEQEKEYATAD